MLTDHATGGALDPAILLPRFFACGYLQAPSRRPRRLSRAGRRERSERERPALAPGELPELGLRQLEALDDSVGVFRKKHPCRGESHAAWAALEESDTGLPLELRELLRDSRRADGELLRGRRDRAASGDLAEQTQTANIKHKLSLLSERETRVLACELALG
jgi:hypothetical protein